MFSFLKIKLLSRVMLIVVFLFLCRSVLSQPVSDKMISMDLQDVGVQDVIRLMAKFNNMNVVISPAIHGVVSLHLRHVSASKALDSLLSTHELNRWQVDDVWFIVPRKEMLQRQQDEIKLRTLLQESSPLLTRVLRIRYAKVEDIARLLRDGSGFLLSKRGHVRIDARTNSLCVQDTEDHILVIRALLKQLDIPVQQVLIEAHLASVDSDFEQKLGVSFSVDRSGVGNGSFQPVNVSSQYNLPIAKLANGAYLDMQLAALESEGHGELISSPSLFTANQQAASIEAGEEIPYQEVSKSGATGVAFKKAVLSLKVTPQIMPDNQVLLQLQVHQDKPSNRMVLGVPAISTRQMSTNILVKNGQTVVLGGIYEENKENGQQHTPFLGKIPIIGWLFKQRSTADNKRELLIFVTPKIIV